MGQPVFRRQSPGRLCFDVRTQRPGVWHRYKVGLCCHRVARDVAEMLGARHTPDQCEVRVAAAPDQGAQRQAALSRMPTSTPQTITPPAVDPTSAKATMGRMLAYKPTSGGSPANTQSNCSAKPNSWADHAPDRKKASMGLGAAASTLCKACACSGVIAPLITGRYT